MSGGGGGGLIATIVIIAGAAVISAVTWAFFERNKRNRERHNYSRPNPTTTPSTTPCGTWGHDDGGSKDENDLLSCSICKEPFSTEHPLVTTPCRHGFGESCLREWIQISGTCPNCRKAVTQNQIYPVYIG